ncbi:MAG: hypothetical protein P3X22_007575 [Thermoprotei archaeon]|nr:hypothetical protein [Thermoprotei archaeon]
MKRGEAKGGPKKARSTANTRRFSLKPSNIKPVSSKITVYEKEALNIIAEECKLSKSTLIKIALDSLIERFLNNNTEIDLKSKLTPGYDIILKKIADEAQETLKKCVNRATRPQ